MIQIGPVPLPMQPSDPLFSYRIRRLFLPARI